MTTRAERIARQDRDPGQPQETVYIKRGGRAGSGPTVYHDTRDCHALNRAGREPKSTTRRRAQRRWLAPCRKCIPDARGGDRA